MIAVARDVGTVDNNRILLFCQVLYLIITIAVVSELFKLLRLCVFYVCFLKFSVGISVCCLYQWYSTFFVRVPPDIIFLQLCTPKVVGV
jgi:hypothetical protein